MNSSHKVICPRCGFRMDLVTEQILLGPITKTCPACALNFQVGSGTTTADTKPDFETTEGWYIRKKDGAVLYFPNRTLLEQWANDGMVRPSDEVSKKGGSWEKVGSLSSFKERFIYPDAEPASIVTPVDIYNLTHETPGRALWITVMASIMGIIAAWMLVSGLIKDDGPAIPDDYLTPSYENIPAELLASTNTSEDEVERVAPEETKTPPIVEPDDEEDAEVSPEPVPEPMPEPVKIISKPEKPATPRVSKPRKQPTSSLRPPPRGASYDQLMSRGSKLLRSNPKLAITTFERALRMPSATSEARAKLGRAYLKTGEISLAAIHLRHALEMNPKYQPALWDLAQAYTVQGNHRRAIEIYRRLQRLVGPNSAQGQKVKAALSRMGEDP
ncbi:MAG: hypothetical protein CMH54_11290 [Myxococcales bacterium]|nr:hypothetical protein [Myxococcales bacterium]